MNKEQKELKAILGEHSEFWVTQKVPSKYIFLKNREISSINGFHLLASFIQLIIGTIVVALSVVEIIQPTWLAAVMSILGSISIITGLILAYTVFSSAENFQSLINKSIKRVILFQN